MEAWLRFAIGTGGAVVVYLVYRLVKPVNGDQPRRELEAVVVVVVLATILGLVSAEALSKVVALLGAVAGFLIRGFVMPPGRREP